MNQSEITALPQTVQTLNDPYSKEIHVKIHELDGESLLQIGVHQSEQRHGEKGLPYWGLKMDELGKLLDAETEGVDINLDFVLEKRLGLIKRNYLGIIGVSMILFLGLFGLQLDKILMYILVFFAPVTFFMGTEYGQIRGLQKESGKSSTDYHATA